MKAARHALAGLLAILASASHAAPVDIVWAAIDPGTLKSPHGAMRVPVTSGGIECRMQVDTGMPTTVFYRGVVPTAWLDESADAVTAPGLAIGGARIPDTKLPFLPGKMLDEKSAPCSSTNPDAVVGTIGLDSLKTGAIVIDMAAGRFEFIAHGVLSTNATDHATVFKFADAAGAYASLPLRDVVGRAGTHCKMWPDPGSAPTGATFVRDRDWLADTDEAGRLPAAEASSWGHPMTFLRGQGRLEIVSIGTNLVIKGTLPLQAARRDRRRQQPAERLPGLLSIREPAPDNRFRQQAGERRASRWNPMIESVFNIARAALAA